jgi:aryl-alcohol dehydrogenase-like predicted oxidoreductase
MRRPGSGAVGRVAFGTWAFGGDWAPPTAYDADQLQALGRHGRVETLQPPYHLFHRDIEQAIPPTPPPTTLACWRTGRWPTACCLAG